MKAKFEIKELHGQGRYFFLFIAGNGHILFASEMYSDKQNALNAIEAIKKGVSDCDIVDLT